MIYLASPYNDPDPAVMEARFRVAVEHAAKLISLGVLVYSPIVHNHPAATSSVPLPRDWSFWKQYDLAMLDQCSQVIVLNLKGCDKSVGVADEVDHAHSKGIPVVIVNHP